MGLRDAEVDVVELPTAWSKRAMYARFCYERGYVMTTNARGAYVKTERSDAQWNEENEKTICSWKKFLSFWESEYPLVRIAAPSADICTECHIFFNRSKYAVAAENLNDRDKMIVVVMISGKIPRAYVGFCFCFFSKQTFLDTFTDGGRARQFCQHQSYYYYLLITCQKSD